MKRVMWTWMLAGIAAGLALGACKREPAKAGVKTNAPTITRPVPLAGPAPEDHEKEAREALLASLYVLPQQEAEGKVFTAADGEIWSRWASGMMIHELRPSSDGRSPMLGQTVSVVYTGMFPGSNRVFDKNDAKNPLTFKFGSKDLIKGFSMAVQTMHPGGKRRVYLPPDLAYGAAGKGDIPGGQALIFELELLSVTGEGIQMTTDDLPKFEPLGPPAPSPASAPATNP